MDKRMKKKNIWRIFLRAYGNAWHLVFDNLLFPLLDFKIEFCFPTKFSFLCLIICPIHFLTNPPSILFCLPRRFIDCISHTANTVFTVKFTWSTKEPIISHDKISELSKQVVSPTFKSMTYDLGPLSFSYRSPSQQSPLLPHFRTPYLLSTLQQNLEIK